MIPDKLTADYSENYKVSIRFLPDGLSFWGYIPSEKDSFFMDSFFFDPNRSVVDSLKNIIFTHPCFSFLYQTFYVISTYGKYTMVSDHVFVEKEKDRLFSYCHLQDESLKVLVQPIKTLNASILFGIDIEIYAFLLRSLSNPTFIHFLSPLMIAWYKRSLSVFPKLMHIVIYEQTMDVLCVEHGNLLFMNSYNFDNNNDIIYYIMYICKQTGFNQLDDYLTVSGKKTICTSILSIIKKYIKQTGYLTPVLNDYHVSIDQELSLDMIALIECGL